MLRPLSSVGPPVTDLALNITTPLCPLSALFLPHITLHPAGSLEHVIDLHQRGQLTKRGKPAVLEYLEREDAARLAEGQAAGAGPGAGSGAGPGAEPTIPPGSPGVGGGWSNWTRRLTAASWAGGVRLRDVMYGYK